MWFSPQVAVRFDASEMDDGFRVAAGAAGARRAHHDAEILVPMSMFRSRLRGRSRARDLLLSSLVVTSSGAGQLTLALAALPTSEHSLAMM